MKRSTTLFPLQYQRHHKFQFLQKLSCQKPYWDQGRLSSLVNKQVAVLAVLCSRTLPLGGIQARYFPPPQKLKEIHSSKEFSFIASLREVILQ